MCFSHHGGKEQCMTEIIFRKNNDNRSADRDLIEKGLRSGDPNVVRQADLARGRLNKESAAVRSMREALVKAHRDNNKDEIADIHDFVERHDRYRNEY